MTIDWGSIADLASKYADKVLDETQDEAAEKIAELVGSCILEVYGPSASAFKELYQDPSQYLLGYGLSGATLHSACEEATGSTPKDILKNLMHGIIGADEIGGVSIDDIADALCARYSL